MHSVTPVQDLCAKLDPRISFHILTEERNVPKFLGAFEPHIVVHGVPDSYRPRKAKHKARALEWFRLNMKLQKSDWVLHLDEETVVDEYLLKTCIDFMTRQDHAEMGMVSMIGMQILRVS
jgi:hypothetical protein